MVHRPPVLVLDEPDRRRRCRSAPSALGSYVRALHASGVTIVLTTHYLEEAQELCDTIAIINHGEVIACEPTRKLISRLDQKTLVVTPRSAESSLPLHRL